jgi:hypothetical protein
LDRTEYAAHVALYPHFEDFLCALETPPVSATRGCTDLAPANSLKADWTTRRLGSRDIEGSGDVPHRSVTPRLLGHEGVVQRWPRPDGCDGGGVRRASQLLKSHCHCVGVSLSSICGHGWPVCRVGAVPTFEVGGKCSGGRQPGGFTARLVGSGPRMLAAHSGRW